MLANIDVAATVAVKDLDIARRFYGETLGLTATEDNEAVPVFQSGGASLVVYASEFAGTNRATSATWGAGEAFAGIVEALQKAGVRFEHYDMPGAKRDGDIHAFGDFRMVWFKDPDGNILHINNG